MELFLFTNFFPYKKSEPFLVNEFEFTKKQFKSITIWSLYGKADSARVRKDQQLSLLQPVLRSPASKLTIFTGGLFNFSPFGFHISELFRGKLNPSKLYWSLTSILLTRLILASPAYKILVSKIKAAKSPLLYFYWGDNLCWMLPYLKHDLGDKSLKTIIRLHRTDLYEHLKADYAPIRKKIFSIADVIVPISEDGRNYLQAMYPQFVSKIKLSRLGVFDHGLNPSHNSSSRTVVSVSGVVEVKRVEKIFEILQKSTEHISWHHFGDGPLLERIKQIASQKRKDLQVFFHGYVENTAIMEFFRVQPVDLLINASASEGLPVSVMEALSFGIPVMATDVGGTSELVNDDVGKLINADFQIEAAAAEVDKLLSLERSKKEKMRSSSRKCFEEKVNAAVNYPDFYLKVIPKDNSSSN